MLFPDNHQSDPGKLPDTAENAATEGMPSKKQQDDHYRELFFYRNLVRENPHNVNYRYEIAQIFIKVNDYENAIEHLRIALEHDPAFSKAGVLIGDCYTWMGYNDRALLEYENASANNEVEGLKKAYAITFGNKNYNEAAKLAGKLIEIEPENNEGRRNLSLCYYMLGEFKKSRDMIAENIKKASPEAADYAQFGSALNRLNKFKQAAEALEKACEIEPENHIYAVNLANVYVTMKRIDDAQALYQTALKHNPQSTVAWFNLGELQLKNRNPADAAASFDKVITLDPQDAEAWMYLARARAVKQPEQALRALNKAKELQLKKDEIRYIQAEILERLGRFKESLPVRIGIYEDFSYNKENVYNLMKLYIRTGSPQDAVALISDIEDINTEDIRLFMSFASFLRFEGRAKEELECLEKVIKCDSEYLPAKERIYDISFESGHYSRAFELGKKMKMQRKLSFRKTYVMTGHLLFIDDVNHASAEANRLLDVAKYIPGYWVKIIHLFKRYKQTDELLNIIYPFMMESNPDTFSFIGVCKALDEAGLYADFEKLCRHRLNDDPDNLHIMNLLGSFLIRRERANETIALLKEYNVRKQNDDINVTLGEAYMKLGEMDRAREYFESVLKKNKIHYQALFGMGLLANKDGDRNQSIDYFNRSLETQTGDFRVWFNRGVLKFKDNGEDNGMEDVFTAFKLAPRNPHILSMLGTICLKSEDYKTAKHYLLKSLAIEPDNKKVWNNLSVLFENTNEYEKAEYCKKKLADEETQVHEPVNDVADEETQVQETVNDERNHLENDNTEIFEESATEEKTNERDDADIFEEPAIEDKADENEDIDYFEEPAIEDEADENEVIDYFEEPAIEEKADGKENTEVIEESNHEEEEGEVKDYFD